MPIFLVVLGVSKYTKRLYIVIAVILSESIMIIEGFVMIISLGVSELLSESIMIITKLVGGLEHICPYIGNNAPI